MLLIKIKYDLLHNVAPLLTQKKGSDASNLIYEYLDIFRLSESEKESIHDEMMADPNKHGDFPTIFKIGML